MAQTTSVLTLSFLKFTACSNFGEFYWVKQEFVHLYTCKCNSSWPEQLTSAYRYAGITPSKLVHTAANNKLFGVPATKV